MSGRNAVFADLMMRTGLRLAEQAALLTAEVPARSKGKRYQKYWLDEAVAKNGSARNIYVPDQVLGAIEAYRVERVALVALAQANGVYEGVADALVTDERCAVAVGTDGIEADVQSLTLSERRRLFIRTPAGLEPAMLWISSSGLPLASSSWQNVFAAANDRCGRLGLTLRCHPHALRHTYAVRTLEQLQRGHLEALGSRNIAQRRHYTMIFGDPLNWVRIRLGHRSAETTAIYLHTLAELEFESRLALVGNDDWDVPEGDEA
jgi:integrase